MVGGTRWKHRSGSASLAALCAETAEAFVSPVAVESQHPWGMYNGAGFCKRSFPSQKTNLLGVSGLVMFGVSLF